MSRPIWTLGHSRHPIEYFIELSHTHDIALIVDVRGQPFSRFNPQFNYLRFRGALEVAGVGYAWYGETLAGRPTASGLRDAEGNVDWDAVRAWPAFKVDVEAVYDRAAAGRIALVCAEEDPLRCHRRFLLTPELQARGAKILHIRGDGRIEDEAAVVARDQPKRDRRQRDLFR